MTQPRSILLSLASAFTVLVAVVCDARESAPDPDCPEFDQFVQEYEFTSRVMDMSASACPGSRFTGAPSYPGRQVKVRIEYLRGHYFVAQETREWQHTPQQGCIQIEPRLVREYRLYKGGKVEWARYAPDAVKRTRDGDRVGNSLIAGTAKARHPKPTKLEDTPFGVQCARIDPSNMIPPNALPGTTLCGVHLPKRCTSELYMAPIEFNGDMPGVGPMRGRTMSLVVGGAARVDPTTWHIP